MIPRLSSKLIFYTLLCLSSWQPAVHANDLWTISVNSRFNELNATDGYSNTFTFSKQLNNWHTGLSIGRHTIVNGTWLGIDIRYQPDTSNKSYGISYARNTDDSNSGYKYLNPLIVHMSIPIYSSSGCEGFFVELLPGFDLQYLSPPADALAGPATGFIVGTSLSLGLRF